MKTLSEYISHYFFCLIDSDYRRHSRLQKALRNQKKTVEDKLDTAEIQNIMNIQQISYD